MFVSARRSFRILSLLIAVLTVFFVVHSTFRYHFPKKLAFKFKNITRDTKIILLWGKWFGNAFLEGDYGKSPLCKYSCESTTDVDMLPVADAIVFHMWDMDMKSIPDYKTKCHKWIVDNQEPPPIVLSLSGLNMQEYRKFGQRVDWTMSYRRDADIWTPYGQVRKTNVSKIIKNVHLKKTKDVVWFVSKCKTPSKRENYVKELQNFINVDVYGDCGPFKCDRWTNYEKCLEMVERDYKFYLSFENALCTDYVTEKLFKILAHNVIPIVRGAVDYKLIMPPNSYIDVNDFKSPEQLANYLKKVSKDKKLFESYFAWKSSHEVFYDTNKACKVCEALHTNLKPQNNRNLLEWFLNEDPRCLKDVHKNV